MQRQQLLQERQSFHMEQLKAQASAELKARNQASSILNQQTTTSQPHLQTSQDYTSTSSSLVPTSQQDQFLNNATVQSTQSMSVDFAI